MSGARGELWTWLAGTALGCVLVLLSAGRAWASVTGTGATAPTGGELGPSLTPLALAGLAGVVAVLATKGVGRRIIGALLALCGAGAAAGAWTAAQRDTLTEWLSAHNAVQATGELVVLWPVVAGIGAVLMVAGGILAAVRGPRWAGMSGRYERTKSAGDDRSLWDALDRGDDPTESR